MSAQHPINISSTLATEPDGQEGREALKSLYTITQQSTLQGKVIVMCKLCEKKFAGLTERMAAHFAWKPNCHVAKCTKVTPEALATGKKVLQSFQVKRAATRKRKAESAVVTSRQTYMRCKDNGEGKEAADKTFLRLLLATGQSFSLGESPYFRDFVTAVTKVPGWKARDRGSLAGNDLDTEYAMVDVESKARLERNGL
eukprot:jgi/Undpi1/7137/HiC_scaffold_22.g09611.m1